MIRIRTALPLVAAAGLLVGLGACANIDSGPNHSIEEVARAAYRHDGPPELTLYTMVDNNTGSGAHTSLLINGSQRVIFDPSGSVDMKAAPEIDDVLYGITPQVRDNYESAHARNTYRVRIQTVFVSPQVAERAIRLAEANGPVGATQCTSATANILRRLPGFESVGSTLFPNTLANRFARLPGVQERVLRENDSDDKAQALAELEAGQPNQ
ncbi:hypothetical protein [Citreimonas sp.]|uniref:hypothetical protein n=1 Tax=Citreimonas sp. TaxID=3036715 RepID=UPI0040596F47